MTGIGEALLKLEHFFTENNIPYMIIGGLANLLWGEPRLTQDIDATVSISKDRIDELVEKADRLFNMRVFQYSKRSVNFFFGAKLSQALPR